MKRKLALFNRDAECTKHQFAYSGEIPCTGPLVCVLCGERADDVVRDENGYAKVVALHAPTCAKVGDGQFAFNSCDCGGEKKKEGGE